MATWERGAGYRGILYDEDTGVQTSQGKAVTGKCIIRGVIVKTDGATDVTMTLYDSLTGSGTKALDTIVLQAEKGTHFIELNKMCATGIYVAITGGTFSWQLFYDQ